MTLLRRILCLLALFPLSVCPVRAQLSAGGGSAMGAEKAAAVIALCDSLREQGVAFTDSNAVAGACVFFRSRRFFHPDDYAKACYYYGRLLRDRSCNADAMQCFLDAVHMRGIDHTLAARLYSNIANICRLEGDHRLAYDIYRLSAEQCRRAGNSVMYYYALNNMAVELSEQTLRDETLRLTGRIIRESTDPGVLAKVWETQANLYRRTAKYDSAVCCVNRLQAAGNHEPTGYMIKAQAFSFMGQADSAVYYARIVNAMTDDIYCLDNMYYILTQQDSCADAEQLRKADSRRAALKTRLRKVQADLSRAVEILRSDIRHRGEMRMLAAVVVLAILVTLVIFIYLRRKNRRLAEVAEHVGKINEGVAEENRLIAEEREKLRESRRRQFMSNCDALRRSANIRTEEWWKDYGRMCGLLNTQMFFLPNKLMQAGGLSEKEVRLCILIAAGFSYREVGDILALALNSIGQYKVRIAKKLGTTAKDLQDFLVEMAVDMPLAGV